MDTLNNFHCETHGYHSVVMKRTCLVAYTDWIDLKSNLQGNMPRMFGFEPSLFRGGMYRRHKESFNQDIHYRRGCRISKQEAGKYVFLLIDKTHALQHARCSSTTVGQPISLYYGWSTKPARYDRIADSNHSLTRQIATNWRSFNHCQWTTVLHQWTIPVCNNPMEIDLVILVAKGEALHDQSSVQEIDDLSKQKRHVKSGEVLRHAGSTNFV
ncbi:hypothetical protein J6590_019239 [Homalodisca vitripennis]|nr:hypothetical protein J6590_019239 [Homalodisca vitripennis]